MNITSIRSVSTGSDLVARLTTLYQGFTVEQLDQLDSVYRDDIRFYDPFHQIAGLAELKAYFARLYLNVDHCSFRFETPQMLSDRAFLAWTMQLQHPKLNRRRMFSVEGLSEVRFSDRIHYHRDYFDGADMLYGRLPLLGMLIGAIRKRL